MGSSKGKGRQWPRMEGGMPPTFRGWVKQEHPGWATEKDQNLGGWDGRSLRKRVFPGGGSSLLPRGTETLRKTKAQSHVEFAAWVLVVSLTSADSEW